MRAGLMVVIFLIVAAAIGDARAAGEERVALLIGNAGYSAKVGPLKNPHNDVTLLADALQKVGFKVTILKDAGYRAIDTAVRTHIQTLRRAGKGAVGFFYYSGHGAADPETRINYLIPVDVETADDTDLWTNSFELHGIVGKLRDQAPEATHYVVFDACRDELRLTSQNKKALGTDKGFAPLATTSGVMIAYATAPGKTASDVGAHAGPYASALAEELARPGVEAVTMFRNVQIKVKQTIGQDPWLSFPTLPVVYFSGRVDDDQARARQVETAVWETASRSGARELIGAYLDRYPAGIHAAEAKALLGEIERKRAVEAAELKAAEERRKMELAALEAQLAAARERQRAKSGPPASAAENDRLLKDLEDKARAAREAARKAEEERKVASAAAIASPPAAGATLAARIQGELKRIGCFAGTPDAQWTEKANLGLARYLQATKQTLPKDGLTTAFLAQLSEAKAKTCASACAAGEKIANGECVAAAPATSGGGSAPVAPPVTSGGGKAGCQPGWANSAFKRFGPC